MRILFILGFVLIAETIAARKSQRQDTCSCQDGTCTVSFQLPKRTKIVNNCPSSERIERQFEHLKAMVNAMHDEMVALANTVQQQQKSILELTGKENLEEEKAVNTLNRDRARWETSVEEEGTVCPMDYEKAGGHCYLIMEEMFNWTYSGQLCKQQGGKLAAIRTDKQQQQIANLLRRYFIEEKVWIGANSLRDPAAFDWNFEGRPSEYYNWATGMPVIKDDLRCVYMSPAHGWQWKVGPCDKHFYFICSRNPTSD